jgi:hypothetical protein
MAILEEWNRRSKSEQFSLYALIDNEREMIGLGGNTESTGRRTYRNTAGKKCLDPDATSALRAMKNKLAATYRSVAAAEVNSSSGAELD